MSLSIKDENPYRYYVPPSLKPTDLMKAFKVPEKYIKVLSKECDITKQKMLKAPKRYHRYIWQHRPSITSFVEKMLKEELSIPLIIENSHFDIILYTGEGAEDHLHRDKVEYKNGYVQYSLVICLDSHITTMNAGATYVHYLDKLHIFNESAMPGYAVLFRSDLLHSSERLMNNTDMKLILKFVVPVNAKISTETLCFQIVFYNCCICNPIKHSDYNKKIYTYSVFNGKHKKLSSDIIDLIGNFRGTLVKCSCPHVIPNCLGCSSLLCVCDCYICRYFYDHDDHNDHDDCFSEPSLSSNPFACYSCDYNNGYREY